MTQVSWVHMHTASKRIERKVLVAQIMKLLFTLKDTSRPIPTHGSTDAMD